MKRVKILQVTGGLNRAGVETWLMHVLRNIDRDRFQMDFLVHARQTYDYEAEAVSLGARVIRCLHPRRPWLFVPALRRVLREYGPYQVVHSHVHDSSGLVLKVAAWAGVPVRVVQSHLDTSEMDRSAGRLRRLYLGVARRLIRKHRTVGLAVSAAARDALFDGEDCRSVRILSYSVNLAPLRDPVNRAEIRSRLGIPEDARVIGHVGRFHSQKNHDFLVRIAAEILRLDPHAWFLLVGDGPLRPRIESLFSGRTTFTGVSGDVAQLMLGAMDAFLFPSHYEGLGLVLVEAQAAGLPCVFSDVIPQEADVVMPLIHRMSLRQSAAAWASTVVNVMNAGTCISQSSAWKLVESSEFGGIQTVRALERIYAAGAG